MRTVLIVSAAFLVVSVASPASAQNRQCLHDQLETAANRTRRDKALELAEEINRAQGLARRFTRPGQSAYKALDELPNLPEVPEGFRVQLNTDGMTYSFSIKDTRDPCGYAVFSDQSLDVYEAVPSATRVRSKLLTQK
jgi:hypothetical protein